MSTESYNRVARFLRKLMQTRLTLQDSYRCPICRHGTLQNMAMMDAFSCSFCRHIFSVNLTDQVLQVEDQLPKSVWRWQGDRWGTLNPKDIDLSILVWVMGVFLVTIPSGVIWLGAYVFPPIGGLMWNSFSVVWGAVTFSAHFSIAAWLLFEHYQLPSYVAARIAIDRLKTRLNEQVRSRFDSAMNRGRSTI